MGNQSTPKKAQQKRLRRARARSRSASPPAPVAGPSNGNQRARRAPQAQGRPATSATAAERRANAATSAALACNAEQPAAGPSSLTTYEPNPHLGRLRVTPARVSYYVRSRDAISLQRTAALNRERAEADRQAAKNRQAFEVRAVRFAAQRSRLHRTHGVFLDEGPALERLAELLLRRTDNFGNLPRLASVPHLAAEYRMWVGLSREAQLEVRELLKAYSALKEGRWDLKVWDRATQTTPEGRAERERKTKSRFARRRLNGALGVAKAAKKLKKKGKRKDTEREDGAEEEDGPRDHEGKGKGRQWGPEGKGKGRSKDW
ncbi:hypothetical protein C8T65DRAFT_824878 [Cerioporus squamosus]|nr:hypothetical protein C8T65DRAFT_824878 [Cerioporus squamosus]